jgi:hypothetical protein
MKPLNELREEDIQDLVKHWGYCIVSNTITMEGMKVGFMYREERMDKEDSGWRFLSGTETDEYLDDPDNSKALSVNLVANYDPAIIPYLKNTIGTEWERVKGAEEFVQIVTGEKCANLPMC